MQRGGLGRGVSFIVQKARPQEPGDDVFNLRRAFFPVGAVVAGRTFLLGHHDASQIDHGAGKPFHIVKGRVL